MARIPGMFLILVSFIPWIIYWVLSHISSFCLILSLVVSIFLGLGIGFNPMVLTSVLYFSLSTILFYYLDVTLVLEKSGFLGYFALFSMAILSIILKRPFTFVVSKRDYPEIYWKDKSFIAINNLISGIWVGVFLINSIIFLKNFYPALASNLLVGLGIIISILLPIKLPAYFAIKEFKKYDWKVEPRGDYDVIIVGAGIGGLSCGALLAKRGYKVLVVEQHYKLGGYCSSFRRGFVFNTGVENVSGLWERGPITYLLNDLGLDKDELFVKNRIRFVYRGMEIDVEGPEDFKSSLKKLFPEESEKIDEFFDEARSAYEECYGDVEFGVPLPPWLIVKVYGEKKLLEYPKDHPHFYDWMQKTYREKLDEFFENEDLKKLLCALMGYVGTKPEKTRAASALTAVVSYYMYGGYFPKGGAENFARALARVIELNGGKVMLNHRVDEIVVENGEVRGVRVGNKFFRSSIVVSNANAKTTFLELVGEGNLWKEFAEYIRNLKMSPSCFMVFLGLDEDLSSYPTIMEDLDEGLSIVINSNADPDLAPPGKASVTVLTGADYNEFPERSTEEYKIFKEEFAKKLIEKAKKRIPIGKITVVDAATPKTFERYTSMPEGAIYAFDQSIGVKRPYFKTPIRGLYLVGASTFPGGGVEAAVISGIICANDICGWKLLS